MSQPQYGETVILVDPAGKRHLIQVTDGEDLHTHHGVLKPASVVAGRFGGRVHTHKGVSFRLMKPTLHDFVKGLKRLTQIIYPKDLGMICIKLGIGPGRTVIESGCGSGALTMTMSYWCGETGHIYSYEKRQEFIDLCRRNLTWAGLGKNVTHILGDAEEGFSHTDADALFLDVRTPVPCIPAAAAALTPGAPIGFLLPTVNQVSELLAGLDQSPFGEIEVMEILVRHWKPVSDRLRPDDRMVAHTAFLVFGRLVDGFGPEPSPAPAPVSPPADAVERPAEETAAEPGAAPPSDLDEPDFELELDDRP